MNDVERMCQCPMSGSRLCTAILTTRVCIILSCVNALCRAHVSAQIKERANTMKKFLCQCPMSGSRLCTKMIHIHSLFGLVVSMPYVGLTSLHGILAVHSV